ncbi:hypothetical protein M378DRAFT_183807 [Amanita muscaria Koide BX008]|uniref:Uncharacterized protein n=1 Tax=Amanita muscaria (strain Koide BX008) TaxID=946122 RepID=A0A0C2X7D3_AMAMK|nr:hypothetical protein M378DRAFT_183807 [Amanita muscaria Koide BX008]
MSRPHNGENASLLAIRPIRPSADTVRKLVKRLRAMILHLLPIEVPPEEIKEPISRIITSRVISTFVAAAGDFGEALPYALLRSRAQFMRDANRNPADYGENLGRATACEVLARRIVHISPKDRLINILSTRFEYGHEGSSDLASALEMAIDQNWFAQDVVQALWRGDIVQKNIENHEIDYVPYRGIHSHSIWSHFNAPRLAVPRYQNVFRICVWLFFLFVYSQAVLEPVERLSRPENKLDVWEVILYIMALAFTIEGKFWRLLRFATWRALNFWSVISFIIDTILLSAFILRVVGITSSGERSADMRLHKLITIFDGFKYIGTMEICVTRMLKESGIFFALLAVVSIGFYQGLFALDAADGTIDDSSEVIHALIQGLLQSPNYGKFSESPASLILYYLWTTVTVIILLNVLISLFASAYSEIVADAEAQYLAFFAGKTISMIRAPDSYVYPAPFNLLEIIFIAPFEFLPLIKLSEETYARLNRYAMTTMFCIPLSIIAIYEASRESRKGTWLQNWLAGDDTDLDAPEIRNPEVHDPACPDMQISRVPFEELVQMFPDIQQSIEATILTEVNGVKEKISWVAEKLGTS